MKKQQQNAFRIDKKLTRKNAISNLDIVYQLRLEIECNLFKKQQHTKQKVYASIVIQQK